MRLNRKYLKPFAVLALLTLLPLSTFAQNTSASYASLTPDSQYFWKQDTSQTENGSTASTSLILSVTVLKDPAGLVPDSQFDYDTYFLMTIRSVPITTSSSYLSLSSRYPLIFPVMVGDDNYLETSTTNGTDLFAVNDSSITDGTFTYNYKLNSTEGSVMQHVEYRISNGLLLNHTSVVNSSGVLTTLSQVMTKAATSSNNSASLMFWTILLPVILVPLRRRIRSTI